MIAICLSDIHLSHKPPAARAGEPDWYEAMKRPLQEVERLRIQHGGVPVICAGDIFDDGWRERKCPPQLINFAIDYLPHKLYAVPGQHDLPHHRYQDIKRSAYWTLVRAGIVTNLPPGEPTLLDGMILHGFPWGFPTVPNAFPPHTFGIHVAVVHSYIWTGGHSYPGAPDNKNVDSYGSDLKGYSAAVFGDNHKGFVTKVRKTRVLNCGAFLRRKIDEEHYRPQVGLLYDTGRLKIHPLDTSADVLTTLDDFKEIAADPAQLARLLEDVAGSVQDSIDFMEALNHFMDENLRGKDSIREIIVNAIQGRK